MTETHSWKFPTRPILRVEILLVVVFAVLVLIFSYYQFDQRWGPAVLFALIFTVLYAAASFGTRKVRNVEEHYHFHPPHLEITRKTRWDSKKEKVHVKDIDFHKLDKLFLGGYLVTRKGKKHLLFFNTKKEVEKFEKMLKKHLK